MCLLNFDSNWQIIETNLDSVKLINWIKSFLTEEDKVTLMNALHFLNAARVTQEEMSCHSNESLWSFSCVERIACFTIWEVDIVEFLVITLKGLVGCKIGNHSLSGSCSGIFVTTERATGVLFQSHLLKVLKNCLIKSSAVSDFDFS